jgi:hypothetical protein
MLPTDAQMMCMCTNASAVPGGLTSGYAYWTSSRPGAYPYHVTRKTNGECSASSTGAVTTNRAYRCIK